MTGERAPRRPQSWPYLFGWWLGAVTSAGLYVARPDTAPDSWPDLAVSVAVLTAAIAATAGVLRIHAATHREPVEETHTVTGPAEALHVQVVWFCMLHGHVVDLDDANRPECGPAGQCTGARRQNLPCGWHALVPLGLDFEETAL